MECLYVMFMCMRWENSVIKVIGYRMDTRIQFVAGAGIFSSLCPDRLWGPPSLSSGY